MDEGRGSWLIPDHTDRERMLDMDRRLQPIRRAALGVLAIALLITAPWLGLWTLVPLAVAAVLFAAADRRIDRAARPEYWLFAAWTGSQLMIAISVLLTGGAESPALAWFAIPIVTLSARFSSRGVVAGVAITLAMLLCVALASDAALVIAEPPLLVAPAALLIAVAILSTALMRSDLEHREESVIDPLTGMLNRKALETRVAELHEQSKVASAPVGIVFADIDHFKRVNDTVGHVAGDAVLRDVANLIRRDLRAFELAYRVGGEEFLILLPGADAPQSEALAERLRERIAGAVLSQGVRLTMSCGVCVSRPDQPLEFKRLLDSADRAMYAAKAQGRDRVIRGEPAGALA